MDLWDVISNFVIELNGQFFWWFYSTIPSDDNVDFKTNEIFFDIERKAIKLPIGTTTPKNIQFVWKLMRYSEKICWFWPETFAR